MEAEPAKKRPVPVAGNGARRTAWCIVLLALVQLCWLQFRSESQLRRIYAVATDSAARHEAMMEPESTDRMAGQVGDGNVWLMLAGYAKTNLAVGNSLGYFYFRTSYDLYPRRVYAAQPDQVINWGMDIMRTGFSPDPQWLQAHDVRAEFIFGNEIAEGEMLRLKILEPNVGQIMTPTNRSGGN